MSQVFTWISGFNMSNLYIPGLRITDIIDMLIVSFLIYQIVRWIKETRAWSLFKGIMVIVLFALFASLFRLNVLWFILSKTLSVGIIALVVVFQPELRKALEQLGKGGFLSVLASNEKDDEALDTKKTLDEIVDAVEKMGKVKTGALILIEQGVPLGDLVSTGIPIDSIVTSQLLINIFEHNTPLHDGAVIIKNNRVAAATCFLPLTESKLSMELGTRHRAAVGASEVSDALVIVVSEETGHISIAKGGKLSRNVAPDKIYSMYGDSKKREAVKKIARWKGKRKHGV